MTEERDLPGGGENPEIRGLKYLRVDPKKLMANNPAALIVNRETYKGMETHFSEIRFQEYPPEAVWVIIYTPQGNKRELMVVDGLTRTSFAANHQGQTLKDAPNFSFDTIEVFDITSEVLQDTNIVSKEEREPEQNALTMEQYLRAVVPHTIVHSEIAPERIASHLINAWVGMVGPELADRFPAISALSFLANPRTSIATDRELQKTLERQEKLVVDENTEERKVLDQALRKIAAIIRQSKLQRERVENAAYFLVGSGSAVIGGSQETQSQIHGMVRSMGFEKKLLKEYGAQLALAENARLVCVRALEETFRKLSDGSPRSEKDIDHIILAMSDESFNINLTLRVVTAESPEQEYNLVKRETNKQKLRQEYQAATRRQHLTDTEQLLISNLGNQTYLQEPKISGLIEEIRSTAAILRQSEEWQQQTEAKSEEWTKRGVNPETISNSIVEMSERQREVMTADSVGILTSRAKKLQETIIKFRDTVAQEILTHEVGISVDRIFGKDLNVEKDPHFRRRVIWSAIHSSGVDANNPSVINKWIRDLKSLDQNLQSDVLTDNMRMDAALRIHRQKKVVTPPAPTIKVAPEDTLAPATPQPPGEEVQTKEPVVIKESESERVEKNLSILREAIIQTHILPSIRLLATLDLKQNELPLDLKAILGQAETL